jgi:hypothetical protein
MTVIIVKMCTHTPYTSALSDSIFLNCYYTLNNDRIRSYFYKRFAIYLQDA